MFESCQESRGLLRLHFNLLLESFEFSNDCIFVLSELIVIEAVLLDLVKELDDSFVILVENLGHLEWFVGIGSEDFEDVERFELDYLGLIPEEDEDGF